MPDLAQVVVRVTSEGFQQVNAGLSQLAQSSDRTQSAILSLVDRLDRASQAADRARQPMGAVAEHILRIQDAIDRVLPGMGRFVTAFAAWDSIRAVLSAVKEGIEALVESAVKIDSIRMTFEYITGGAASAGREIQWLTGIADKYGKSMDALLVGSRSFESAAKNAGLSVGESRMIIEGLTRASAVLGISAQDTAGALRSLQQMVSKGRVQSEELRRELGNHIPGAADLAAKALGVTTAEMWKMVEQGKVLSTDFLPKFGQALMTEFADKAELASGVFGAHIQRMENAWEKFKIALSDTSMFRTVVMGVTDMVTAALNQITKLVNGAQSAVDFARNQGKISELREREKDLRGQTLLPPEQRSWRWNAQGLAGGSARSMWPTCGQGSRRRSDRPTLPRR